MVSWSDQSGEGGDASGSSIKAQVFRFDEDNIKPNIVPVAGDAQAVGAEDTLIAGQVTATDADGDTLTYALVQDAQDVDGNAVAGLSFNDDGSFSFQGPQDFAGTVSFTYTASDGKATSDEPR